VTQQSHQPSHHDFFVFLHNPSIAAEHAPEQQKHKAGDPHMRAVPNKHHSSADQLGFLQTPPLQNREQRNNTPHKHLLGQGVSPCK
jgi:hypothetical protein